jgi:hypothetical protein
MKNKSIDQVTLRQTKDGLVLLGDLLDSLVNQPVDVKPDIDAVPVGGISGNKISGGTISNFSSTGIKDKSTRLVVLVEDDGITTDSIDVETLVGNTNVTGDLNVSGDVFANKIHVNELVGDLRNSSTESMEFTADKRAGLYNKGLLWSGEGKTHQFVLRNNPDRIWTNLHIELSKENALFIGNEPVISATGLGSGIADSNLRSVGLLKTLNVNGDVRFGDGFAYNASEEKIGIGTLTPKGNLSVAGWSSEFIVDVDDVDARVGTFSASKLDIITDNTARISISQTGKVEFGVRGSNSADVSVHGKLGIGVTSVGENVSLASSGPISFENKTMAVSDHPPRDGAWKKGDIVWNSDPKPSGKVGWVCVTSGTPGQWKEFGQISG